MVMEFAVGRASQKSVAKSFHVLEPKGTKWHLHAYTAMAGNYLLMFFYTTVCGWMMSYFVKMATGVFDGMEPQQVGTVFDDMLSNPISMTVWMIVSVVLGFGICSMGLQKGGRAHYQGNDVLFIYHYAGFVRSQCYPARCWGRLAVLPFAGLYQNGRTGHW